MLARVLVGLVCVISVTACGGDTRPAGTAGAGGDAGLGGGAAGASGSGTGGAGVGIAGSGVGGTDMERCSATGNYWPCPSQNPNEYCVYGRVTLFTSDNAAPDMRTPVSPCARTCGVPGAPACPCVKIYNPTAFVVGARTAIGTRLGADNAPEAALDDAGRWVIHKVPKTTTGFIAAVVDDCDSSDADDWAFTAVGGEQDYTDINLYRERNTVAIAKSLSDSWVKQAGRDIFNVGGSYIGLFRGGYTQTVPVQGVRPTAPATMYVNASNTIYFGDTLSALDPQRPFEMGTGISGAVLINPPEVTNQSGIGGGLVWEDILGGSADGAYFVHRFRIR